MSPASDEPISGLSTTDAQARLELFGPNAVPEERPHPLWMFLRKFWAPVPWMLEVTLVLELSLGKAAQGIIIGSLLTLNAILSFIQERRASGALDLLRQRLAILVRVLRDGHWQQINSQSLVPGDVIRTRVGDFIPADLHLRDGQILVDQSSLTGESAPREVGDGDTAFAGSVVRRGEATAEVTATGSRTAFGKTAELVRTATAPSRMTTLIFTIVKYLVAIDLLLVAAILVYAVTGGIPLIEIIPFALILLVASVPVALPATYTLASAVGSLELSQRGVLVTRLSAVEEAASMDVLCSDKTGTITRNQLAVAALQTCAPHSDNDLLRLAALACEESTQDPIDLAILDAARHSAAASATSSPPARRLSFLPFDPATKRSEAVVQQGDQTLHVVKGAPGVVAALSQDRGIAEADVQRLAARGCRVLAVAAGPENRLQAIGLIALLDPPRDDSAAALRELEALGIRVVMVTGDSAETAQAIASQVGITGRVCQAADLHRANAAPDLDCAIFAGVFPEDKFRLVQALQNRGHVVGMTGDGVNDAPALKQAEVGIAVANATDVAKAAASLVLTRPGLSDVQAAVETGRRIHQRMLTYTLNKIVKTIQIALLMSLGLWLTGEFITTPRLVLLLMFANDFVTMSLADDRVTFSRQPDRWRIAALTVGALLIAIVWLALTFALFVVGRDRFHLDLPQLQTLVFVTLVFTGQATVYLVRERRHFWMSAPGFWLMVTSAAAMLVVSLLACGGILMTAIRPELVVGVLVVVAACATLMDFVKVRVFQHYALQ